MRPFNEGPEYREESLWAELRTAQERIEALERRTQELSTAVPPIPPIFNLVLNGDAGYSHGGMVSSYTHADKEKVAAHWYTIQSSAGTQLTEHSGASESSQALRDSSHASYGTPACDWYKANGYFRLGGDGANGFSLVHPLSKNLAAPGKFLFVQAIVKADSGVTISDTHQLEAALFENIPGSTLRRVIEGTGSNLTLVARGTTGATTRKYVVETVAQNGSFRTNVTDITNSNATLSAVNYVDISWKPIFGVIEHRIYRSEDGGATYKKIATLTGGTSFYDTGIIGVSASLPSAGNQKAFARIKDFGELLAATTDWQKVTFAIQVPPYYVMPSGAGDKHLLEIRIVDSSGSPVNTTALGVLVDLVGLSFTNGAWSPAPEDLTTTAPVLTTTPDAGQGRTGTQETLDPGDGQGCITRKCQFYDIQPVV